MDERKYIAYLSLGSNLGDRKRTIEQALTLLEESLGKMRLKSSYYASEAWGQNDLNEFYNIVAAFEIEVEAQEVLRITQAIEQELGRRNKSLNQRYHNRYIDIDILFLNQKVIESVHLTVPHPLLHERKFVLMPLNELSPLYFHPILKKTVEELLASVEDTLACKKIIE